jgi:hypothetical protein
MIFSWRLGGTAGMLETCLFLTCSRQRIVRALYELGMLECRFWNYVQGRAVRRWGLSMPVSTMQRANICITF